MKTLASLRSLTLAPVLVVVAASFGAMGCMVTTTLEPADASAAGDQASVDVFTQPLAEDGDWIDTPDHGRVWRPSIDVVGTDFVPYSTGGRWVATDAGWSFESDYDFGWATYHYGRWYSDARLGWVWTPDVVWAPAWVEWRSGGGYVGWVPAAPAGVVVLDDRWTFVEERYLVSPNIRAYALPYEGARRAYVVSQPSRALGGGGWRQGPSYAHVSAAAGVSIRPVHAASPAGGVVHAGVRPTGQGSARPVRRPSVPRGGHRR